MSIRNFQKHLKKILQSPLFGGIFKHFMCNFNACFEMLLLSYAQYSIIFFPLPTIYFCFVWQGSDSDVWGDEDVRSHLRETLVAGSVPHCVQDLWQHEASWATDWGKSTSALKSVLEENKISLLGSVTSRDIAWTLTLSSIHIIICYHSSIHVRMENCG